MWIRIYPFCGFLCTLEPALPSKQQATNAERLMLPWEYCSANKWQELASKYSSFLAPWVEELWGLCAPLAPRAPQWTWVQVSHSHLLPGVIHLPNQLLILQSLSQRLLLEGPKLKPVPDLHFTVINCPVILIPICSFHNLCNLQSKKQGSIELNRVCFLNLSQIQRIQNKQWRFSSQMIKGNFPKHLQCCLFFHSSESSSSGVSSLLFSFECCVFYL